jgi:hypothetical protein
MTSTETEGRHLHIHLGDIAPGITDIHIHVGAPDGEAAAGAKVTVETGAEASLARLKDWAPASAEHIQALYDGLLQMGCTPHSAKPRDPRPGAHVQPYVRWTYPGHVGSVTYLNATGLTFAGRKDCRRIAGMPGADSSGRGPEVRFRATSDEGVKQALDAAKAVVEGGGR